MSIRRAISARSGSRRLTLWHFPPGLADRRYLANSSCGICGKAALDEIEVRCDPVGAGPRVPGAVIRTLPARLADRQRIFDATGGLHAAARFTPNGDLIAVREDV